MARPRTAGASQRARSVRSVPSPPTRDEETTIAPPFFAASFDSATAMVQALADALHDRPFTAVGQSRLAAALARRTDVLPWAVRRQLYIWSGWADAIPPLLLPTVSWQRFGRWVTDSYPRGPHAAVAIGSSNGAAVHLFAATATPWLPQTFMVPVQRSGDPDDPLSARRFGEQHGPRLLDAQPDLALHHMHDANQDRLMVRRMTYFRVKGRRLSPAYRRFLSDELAPGGTVIVVDCRKRWPVSRLGDRHVFQHGAVGGMPPQEYEEGSERVAQYLAAYDAGRRSWPPTHPDDTAAEAEWGFDEHLLEDVVATADGIGARVVRVSFDEPVDLSAPVADLYDAWWRRLGGSSRRVLGESFMLMAPQWTLRARAVPFWMSFPVEADADALASYLDDRGAEELLLLLFSHGVRSVGTVGARRWRELLDGVPSGRVVGSDLATYPRDFAVYGRYHRDLPSATHERPTPLDVDAALTHLAEAGIGVEEVT